MLCLGQGSGGVGDGIGSVDNVWQGQPMAARPDRPAVQQPMMMESAMLPDSRYHYPDRCPPQDGDGDGSDTDTDLGMPMRCTGDLLLLAL